MNTITLISTICIMSGVHPFTGPKQQTKAQLTTGICKLAGNPNRLICTWFTKNSKGPTGHGTYLHMGNHQGSPMNNAMVFKSINGNEILFLGGGKFAISGVYTRHNFPLIMNKQCSGLLIVNKSKTL